MPRTASETLSGTVSLSYPTSSRRTARVASLRLEVDDTFYEVTLTADQLLGLMSTLVVDGVVVERAHRVARAVR